MNDNDATTKEQSTTRRKTEHAVSAGGIVIRPGEHEPEVALVGFSDRNIWVLPKGTLFHGETMEDAAVRETREETGLQVVSRGHVGDIGYWFTMGATRIHKKVAFYLMDVTGGDVTLHDHEHDLAAWFPAAMAERLLTHANERGLLHKALQHWRVAHQPEKDPTA